jgi:hypothetical protein
MTRCWFSRTFQFVQMVKQLAWRTVSGLTQVTSSSVALEFMRSAPSTCARACVVFWFQTKTGSQSGVVECPGVPESYGISAALKSQTVRMHANVMCVCACRLRGAEGVWRGVWRGGRVALELTRGAPSTCARACVVLCSDFTIWCT